VKPEVALIANDDNHQGNEKRKRRNTDKRSHEHYRGAYAPQSIDDLKPLHFARMQRRETVPTIKSGKCPLARKLRFIDEPDNAPRWVHSTRFRIQARLE